MTYTDVQRMRKTADVGPVTGYTGTRALTVRPQSSLVATTAGKTPITQKLLGAGVKPNPGIQGKPFKPSVTPTSKTLAQFGAAAAGATWANRWNNSAQHQEQLANIRNAAAARGKSKAELQSDLQNIRAQGYPSLGHMIEGYHKAPSIGQMVDNVKAGYNKYVTQPIYNTLYGGLNSTAPSNGTYTRTPQQKPWYKFW